LLDKLIKEILDSKKQSIARGISLVENESPHSRELLKSLFKNTGKAFLIGVTGPPGAGKSTITNLLTRLFRENNYKVGIIAVDPTSPFTGGALLGDRIRMQEIGTDKDFSSVLWQRAEVWAAFQRKRKKPAKFWMPPGKILLSLKRLAWVNQSSISHKLQILQ
jgi:energy-coupling factor transporter ATP-binding protein EcfA2